MHLGLLQKLTYFLDSCVSDFRASLVALGQVRIASLGSGLGWVA